MKRKIAIIGVAAAGVISTLLVVNYTRKRIPENSQPEKAANATVVATSEPLLMSLPETVSQSDIKTAKQKTATRAARSMVPANVTTTTLAYELSYPPDLPLSQQGSILIPSDLYVTKESYTAPVSYVTGLENYKGYSPCAYNRTAGAAFESIPCAMVFTNNERWIIQRACKSGEVPGTPAKCKCLTQLIGNPKRCK